jgi:hypothetical protein
MKTKKDNDRGVANHRESSFVEGICWAIEGEMRE